MRNVVLFRLNEMMKGKCTTGYFLYDFENLSLLKRGLCSQVFIIAISDYANLSKVYTATLLNEQVAVKLWKFPKLSAADMRAFKGEVQRYCDLPDCK